VMRRYGVANVQQVSCIRDRSAKTRRNAVVKKHWKTGDDIVCVGSYERAVVDWLNDNHVDFRWQVPVLIEAPAPDCLIGRTYFVDLYVVDGVHGDTFVEIKGGWPRDLQRMKWDWFHSTHENSQLWDAAALKRIGVFNAKGRS